LALRAVDVEAVRRYYDAWPLYVAMSQIRLFVVVTDKDSKIGTILVFKTDKNRSINQETD
jgi:hypothetical protein